MIGGVYDTPKLPTNFKSSIFDSLLCYYSLSRLSNCGAVPIFTQREVNFAYISPVLLSFEKLRWAVSSPLKTIPLVVTLPPRTCFSFGISSHLPGSHYVNTLKPRVSSFNFVGSPGFEPGQTEPKSVVLPLHHEPI